MSTLASQKNIYLYPKKQVFRFLKTLLWGISYKYVSSFLFVILFLLLPTHSFSQSCANYTVTRTTGITYTTIAGTGTSAFIWRNTASNQNDDNRSYAVAIGFDFWYLGVRYTNISATLNGAVDFSTSTADGNLPSGSSPYGSNWSSQFSSGGANGTMLALAILYGDLWTSNGGTTAIATSLVYKLSGAAPNRVLTVEWINFDHWNSPTNSPYASYNFQVKIYETTGVIEFVYGTMTGVAGGSYPLQYACGISNYWTPAAAPTAAQLLTQQTANTTTFNNTPKNNLTTIPASNSQLTFTPPTPTAAPTGLSFTAVAQTGMTLNWTDNASNENAYVIYNSTDNINFSFVSQVAAGSVSAAITGLLSGITYYWQVYAVTEGASSSALTGTQATLAPVTYYSLGGNWSVAATWSTVGCGGVAAASIPGTGDNVVICDATTVTLDVNAVCNLLTVGGGLTGQLTIGNDATVRTLTVNTDVIINAGATMTIGATAATHLMTLGGNLTNSGTLNLAPTATRVCNITFNKNGNQTISGAGATTNFNLITLNMGTSNANVLDITSTNFTVLPTNFLTLTNGTFKLSTSTAVLTPFTGAVTMPLSTGLWLNNSGATMSTGATVTLYGYVRATAGTLNIGNASDENLTSYGGTITIDGGTLNIAGRLDRAGLTILTYLTISSGTLTVATLGSTTAGAAPFRMDETGSTFNMSGGTIIIERPGAGNLGYVNTGGTVGTVSGGTLQIGDASTPAAQTILINASVSIFNLVVSNGVAVTAQLSNNLTVLNNVTINSGTFNLVTYTANRTVVGGSLTNAAGATLKLAGSTGGQTGSNFPLNFTTITLNATSTVEYNSATTVNQTVFAPVTYGHLTLTNSTGSGSSTKSLTANITDIAGNLTVNGFATFDLLTFNANRSVAGSTLSLAANAILKISGTTGGASANNNFPNNFSTITMNQASTVEYYGATQTIYNTPTYGNLTITTVGTKTAGGNLIIAGNLLINTGATFNGSTFSHTVTGNWTNSGTFTAGTTTVTFNGTAAQQIIGASTSTFNNLILTNTSTTGLTLTAPSAIGGILTLTDGYLYTDATNLLTMNAGSSVGAVSDNSFVYGPVAKTGSTDFTFPLGKNVKYRPISITSLSGSETFTATYFNSDPNLVPYDVTLKDATLDHIGRCEYWILNRAAAVNAFVTLSWDGNCGVDDLTNIAVARWDGALWKDHGNGGTTGAIDPGTGTVITSAIVTAFSPFTLASKTINNPLPIELLSFTANCTILRTQNFVSLKWRTATEINNNYFTIERSKEAINWQIVDTVDGAGNSSAIRNYSFADLQPYNGVSYYRLKQTDFDGNFKYSDIIAAENCIENVSELTIYPNPNIGIFTVESSENKYELSITNVLGEKLFSRKNQSEKSNIDLSNQPNGFYLLQIKSGNGIESKKIIINK